MAQAALRVRADITFAVIDLFVVVAAYTMATAVRMLDPDIQSVGAYWEGLGRALPFLVLIHLVANVVVGAYGHVWEYASISEARQVVAANAVAAVVVVAGARLLNVLDPGVLPVFPNTVALLGSLIALLGMGLVRFRSRLFSLRRASASATNVLTLVIGTGRPAVDFARETGRIGKGAFVVGFVDPDHAPTNLRLAGLPVLGRLGDLPELISRYDIQQVVVAGDTDDALIRKVVDACIDVDVRLRIAPGAGTVLDRHDGAIDIRDIEFQDLLPRPEIATDLAEVSALLKDKRVLVTGAGGSIGSEIVRQVLTFEPESVVALDNDETHLHEALLRLGAGAGRVNSILCDIRDAGKVRRVMQENQPHVVFHAAALKHVPVLESYPEEALITNVIGTQTVIEACSWIGVDRFVLISTDKAVDPSSVMGATKRIAEMLTQVADRRRDGCVYTGVRFGNVLGSRGSVVPTFVHQIKNGGPVTVTDVDMTRYFMTVPEAVQLVLQAATLAEGGEVFVLDMGEPVKIIDLARRMIRLAGLVPGRDIGIVTTGMRPGEKLAEVLSEVPLEESPHPRINIARPPAPGPVTLLDAVAALERMVMDGDVATLAPMIGQVARLAAPDQVLDIRKLENDPARAAWT